jgi:hypothetical protein
MAEIRKRSRVSITISHGVLLTQSQGISVMTNTTSGFAAFALLTFAAITPSAAAEPNAPPPVQDGAVYAGMPCPSAAPDGTRAHFVWEQGYVNKGKWEYHWACEF